MRHDTLVERIEDEVVGPSGLRHEDRERLLRTLERFSTHLTAKSGVAEIEDTTLEALRAYPFDLEGNDDHNLRLVFQLYGRDDLLAHLSMVSADKYFRNKRLRVALKAVDGIAPHVKALGKVKVRMATDLLAQGATKEGRARLAAASGVPEETILRMVECCDLSRMTGMGGKTLARSLAMGYETLAAFRASTPERIRQDLEAYLLARDERTSRMIDYGSFVHQARRLEDVIEY